MTDLIRIVWITLEVTETKEILVLPGDGIGTEVVPVAREVMESVARRYDVPLRFTEGLVGGIAIDQTGNPLPGETLAKAVEARAVHFQGSRLSVDRPHSGRPGHPGF